MGQTLAHWYQNPEWWSAIGTIFATVVALGIASYTEVSGRIRRWAETRERRKCLAIALMMDLGQTAKAVDRLARQIEDRARSSQPRFQADHKIALRLPELTHLFGSVAQFYVLGRDASADVLALAAGIRSWNHEIDQPDALGCDEARDGIGGIKTLVESSRQTLEDLVGEPAA